MNVKLKIGKKGLLLVLALTMAVTLAGCLGGQGAVSVPELKVPGEASSAAAGSAVSGTESAAPAATPAPAVTQDDVDDTLDGLCKYLEGNHAVAGERVEMSYEVIGAIGGYKYTFAYNGKNLQVEVYEFEDTDDNIKTLKEINETGKMTVLDKEVEAYRSQNGKYVMIYSDTADDELNKKQKERVLELFSGFKAVGNK